MASLNDKNNVPALPVFWTDPTNGHKVYWDTVREHWLTFLQKINDYCDGNNKGRPPESEVENQVCAQFPKWACSGPVEQFPPGAQNAAASSSGGCCGRRS